jgi:hypothetical protein
MTKKISPIRLNGIASLFQRKSVFGATLAEMAKPVAPEPGERIFDWNLSPQDRLLIEQIVQRMVDIAIQHGQEKTFQGMLCAMDLACVHLNNTPLNLLRLLMSDQEDFTHDVLGIGVHIDRKSGQLRNGFKPRFAVKKS